MYRSSRTLVSGKRHPELHAYLSGHSMLARSLYNASLFRLRQNFTMKGKSSLSQNEQQVQDEIRKTVEARHAGMPGRFLSYTFLDKLMRATENPDFFAGLPMQSAQEVLKSAIRNMKAWKESMAGYRKDPSGYLGRPKMPKYKKPGVPVTVTYTNQDCIVYHREDGTSYLELPKTSLTVEMPYLPENGTLMEVKAVPYYGDFLLICTFLCPDADPTDAPHACGIDLGVDNTAALVSSSGHCVLYKGGAAKAMNQWYNRKTASLRSAAMKGHSPEEAARLGLLHTKQMDALSRKRDLFLKDYLHKVSADIVRFCLEHGIGTIVIGVNADLTAGDIMPVYKKNGHTKHQFSGKRTSRGLYRTHSGQLVNADLNGAGNILRKAFPDIFKGKDFAFLQKILVRNYRDLNKRIPVKGIGAA